MGQTHEWPAMPRSEFVSIAELARATHLPMKEFNAMKEFRAQLQRMNEMHGGTLLVKPRGSAEPCVQLAALTKVWPDLAKAIEAERTGTAGGSSMVHEVNQTIPAGVENDLREELFAIRHLIEQLLDEVGEVRGLMSLA